MLLRIRIKPGSRRVGLDQEADGTWVARVHAPPVEGKANSALIALLAAHFRCPKSAIRIKSGATSRCKLVEVAID